MFTTSESKRDSQEPEEDDAALEGGSHLARRLAEAFEDLRHPELSSNFALTRGTKRFEIPRNTVSS